MIRVRAIAIFLLTLVALLSIVLTTHVKWTKYAFEDVSNGFLCASAEHLFLRDDVPDSFECSRICFLYGNCITAEFNPENLQCFGCSQFSFHAIPWSKDRILTSRRDYHIDCKDVLAKDEHAVSGVYEIRLYNLEPIDVYCDMDTQEGGWTTFADYESGFGKVDDEYWLGLRLIHELTVAPSEMRTIRVARSGLNDVIHSYQTFKLTRRDYEVIGEPTADFTHSLDIHNVPFHTYDHDTEDGCAAMTGGGWWFDTCRTLSNFNFNSRGVSYSSSDEFKAMNMMVRRK